MTTGCVPRIAGLVLSARNPWLRSTGPPARNTRTTPITESSAGDDGLAGLNANLVIEFVVLSAEPSLPRRIFVTPFLRSYSAGMNTATLNVTVDWLAGKPNEFNGR